jgi:hypothetical protein
MSGMIVGGFIPSTPQYVNENIPGLPAIADMTNKVRFLSCDCPLLLEINETPLSKLMQILQFRYTRNFNINFYSGADRFGKYCVKHIKGFIVQQHP